MAIKYILRQEVDKNDAIILSKEAGVSLTLAKLLIARGISKKEDALKFLNPSPDDMCDPYSLYGMSQVVERIKIAIEKKESILIYGDYDCDGLTGTSLLYSYLRGVNDNISYYIPNRHAEGYGLHNIIIEDLSGKNNIDLIITVDCGVTSREEVKAIKSRGIDVVVTDHHEYIPDLLPDCPVLDPKVDKSGFYDFCGAGVVLKLVEALAGRDVALKYVALAAIGTIADIVPLIGENRIIAKYGIDDMNAHKIHFANVMMAKQGKDNVSAGDIMFKYAPRINALGRLKDATPIIDFFTSSDETVLSDIADKLDVVNKERQSLCENIVEDIMDRLKQYDLKNHKIIVLKNTKWNVGILGIAASKIAETFNRPVILFSKAEDGQLRGSARSISSINIFDCLTATKDYLITYGGHAQAAGISIEEKKILSFTKAINDYIIENYDDSCYYPTCIYDLILDETIDYNAVSDLERLEPCGFGNQPPVFLLENKKLRFSRIGVSMHLKAYYNDIEIMAFNYAYKFYEVNNPADFILTLQNKEFKSKKYTQAVVKSTSLCDVNEFSEQVFAMGYLMSTVLYPRREVLRPIHYCNIEDIDVNDGIYGNLYIAYTKDAYDEFLAYCKKKEGFLMTCVNNSQTPNPYNTLVLMPTMGFDYGYYRNIYFLKPPAIPTILGCLQSISKADIYLIDRQNAYVDIIRRVRCQNDDEYRTIFKEIRQTNFYGSKDLTTLKIKLMEQNNPRFFKIISTFYILFELGIVGMDEKDGFYFVEGIKANLEDSETYRYINSF